jgi:parvulin-like peptidyl-prolyl isomerase
MGGRAPETKRGAALAVGAIAALALGACSDERPVKPAPASAETDAWIAKIGDEVVPLSQFSRAFAETKAEYRGVPAHEHPSWTKLKEALLEDFIEQRLLLLEARRRGLKVPPEEVDRAIRLAGAGYDRDHFEEALLRSGRTHSDFRASIQDRLLIDTLFREAVYQPVRVEEIETRQRFDAQPERYSIPEAVRVRQIAVRTEPEARKLRDRLQYGAKFEDLARRYSVSPDGLNGGDLGFIARGQKPKAFEDACFHLAPGKISPVTPSDYAYHLFQVVEKRPARARTFEESRAHVVAEIRREKERAAEETFRRELRTRAEVQVNQSLLAKVK